MALGTVDGESRLFHSGGAGHPALGAGEVMAHLVVRRLPKIVIPETDGVKRFRSLGADHLVDDVAHRFADEREATGTAPTSQAGFPSRKASAPARSVDPVARPSSTRMTVLPVTSGGAWEPR